MAKLIDLFSGNEAILFTIKFKEPAAWHKFAQPLSRSPIYFYTTSNGRMKIRNFMTSARIVSLILLLLTVRPTFANPPTPQELFDLMLSCDYETIKAGLTQYEKNTCEWMDKISSKYNQPEKSLEEKKQFFKNILNKRGETQLTPLLLMILITKIDYRIFQLLLEKGADVSVQFPDYSTDQASLNKLIKSPISLNPTIGDILNTNAIRYSKESILGILIAQEAPLIVFELFLNRIKITNPEQLRTITKVYTTARDRPFYFSVLSAAIKGKHFEMVKLLIEAGCDINQQEESGGTPFHFLVGISGQKRDPRTLKYQRDLIKLFIKEGCDFTVKCKQDMTPLDLATYLQDYKLARLIMYYALQSPNEYLKNLAIDYEIISHTAREQAEEELQNWASEVSTAAKKVKKDKHQEKKKPIKKKGNKRNPQKEPSLEPISDIAEENEGQFLSPRVIENTEDDPRIPWQFVKRLRKVPQKKDDYTVPGVHQIQSLFLSISVLEPNEDFQAHINQRQTEVGNHDIPNEHIWEILSNPTYILEQTARIDGKLRYIFIAPYLAKGGFARVVVSKGSDEEYFQIITAYRSDKLPPPSLYFEVGEED